MVLWRSLPRVGLSINTYVCGSRKWWGNIRGFCRFFKISSRKRQKAAWSVTLTWCTFKMVLIQYMLLHCAGTKVHVVLGSFWSEEEFSSPANCRTRKRRPSM